MKGCDIIIPVWNQLEVTRECIDSILRHTDYPYRLIIIDNGSAKDTEEYLKGLSNVKGLDILLVRNDANVGFVKAINQGIEKSSAPYVCIANNDIVVTSGWLKELVAIMDANTQIGLVNPSSSTSGENPDAGESIDEYAARLSHFKGNFQELYTCRGYCMLVRREVLNALGPLDEIYHFGYFDDTDYCKRAQGLGFKTAKAKASYIYHKGSVSFKNLENSRDLFEQNEKIFYKRWGRPVRVGYFLDHSGSGRNVDEIAHSVAQSGHQIWIFMKKGMEWPVTLDHYDIRRIDLSPPLFTFISFYKILKRRRKKKLEILITDDAVFGGLLKLTKFFHGSDVLVNAPRNDLMALMSERSKVS